MNPLLIGNVRIVSMDPDIGDIPVGFIHVEGGTIRQVAPMSDLDQECTSGVCIEQFDGTYIDGHGLLAYPGFIDAHNHLGMFDDHLGWEGSDGNEATHPSTPELRAIDSIFHDDVTMEESLKGGITCSMTGPGSTNIISGQFAVIKPVGRRVEDMVVLSPAAMKVALGDNPKGTFGQGKQQRPSTRMGNAAVLRESLTKAKVYAEKKAKAESNDEIDMALEALVPVINRELILKIHCHRTDDILTAIRICNEFGLRYTLDHCTEGYLITDILVEEYARRNEPGHGTLEGIILGPLISSRSKPELTRRWSGSAALTYQTGIPMAIATDHPIIPIQYTANQAALLMRDGLTREAALSSLTTAPARILGLQDRLGRLAPGLDADIVLWTEDPLLPWANAKKVIVDGKLVYEN